MPSRYDESNTYIYEGTLSRVDCDVVRWRSFWIYYTLCFEDGQEFTIHPVVQGDLLDRPTRGELEALPAGTQVTVIVMRGYKEICSFWTDERVFISLDDYNAHARRNKLFWFILDAFWFLTAVPLEVLYWFDAFRQLRISRGKQRRKAKRKQLRSELKNPRKKM